MPRAEGTPPAEGTTVTSAALRRRPLPPPGQDKESRGRTLVVGGSDQTPGAVLLAAEAALRSGAGKLQVATVGSTAAHLGVALPEAMVCPLPSRSHGDIDPAAAEAILGLCARDAEPAQAAVWGLLRARPGRRPARRVGGAVELLRARAAASGPGGARRDRGLSRPAG